MVLREAEFLIELSHECITKLQGFVEDTSKDKLWLVFPWQDNGDLRDFLASRDWEIPERIWLIDNVVEGVEYLHDQKPPICHGDLKSLNILVNSECRALITDFGSARPPLELTFCDSTSTITLTGNKYTLRWAAPELLMEDQLGLWSDIWAMGWIFYEVITNAIPFQDIQTDLVVIQRVIQGDLPSITDHARMSLIWELCSLIIECWNIEPRKRPTAKDCRKVIAWMVSKAGL
ncbi:hypothetical protein M407DRAFT_213420 [Tulasnella calospora MUT 4182]|uniref:Protein kinase domain-containing protein n=1 Tax=Tulasnella calospora MUT 4182 TaxID=1051891 RepID=A0A0C3Q4V5_9AGAM|nr:hypothetical protein M407DRAFT_213420 [Tulasnella calospora MUT 4182]